MNKLTLVVGATGVLGSEVCRLLAERGAPVRALVRTTSNADTVSRLKGLGAELVQGDVKDRASLDAACRGAGVVVSTVSSTLSRQEGDSIDTVDRQGQLSLIDAAAAAGVAHFVLVSFGPVEIDFPLQAAKRAAEERLRHSGMTYTILQPTAFMEVWLSPALGFDLANQRATIYGSGENKASWISVQDVAAFTVAAIDAPQWKNAVVKIGGPDALSSLEVVRLAEETSGKPIAVQHVPEEALRAQYDAAGDPLQKSFAALMLYSARGDVVDMAPILRAFPAHRMKTVRDYLRVIAVFVLMLLTAAGVSSQTPRTHDLKLTPENVHWGYYDPAVKPVLRIASGDTIRVETMIARGLLRLRAAGVKEEEIPEALKVVERAVTERGPGAHPMTGPVWVDGAEPGDSLEVRIVAIDFLHPYGVSGFIPGGGTLPDEFPYVGFHLVRFDPRAGTATFVPGVTLKLAPFFGSIGVAPHPLSGRISSGPPGAHTGNLDNKDLVAGSTLFVPVHVPGALLSIGDGHAMQGDGEVTGTALETSLRGTVQVTVRKGKRLAWPRAETPTHYIAMGLHTDLDEAAKLATREMIDFLVAEKKMTRDQAYILCSVAADLRVTQVVDGTKGVHAMLAKSIFSR